MASQIQMVMYEGYLGADPEMRFLPASGKAVTDFRMGSSKQFKDAKGDAIKQTTWLKVTAWGKLAEIVNQYCAKGSHVIVTGTLKANETGNPSVFKKNNGEYGSSFEITANEIRILNKQESVASGQSIPDDELPF